MAEIRLEQSELFEERGSEATLHYLNFASVYSLKYFYEAASSREPFIERYQHWPSHVLALSLSDSYYFNAANTENSNINIHHTWNFMSSK